MLATLAAIPATHSVRKRCRPRSTPSSPDAASCTASSAVAAGTSSDGSARVIPSGSSPASAGSATATPTLASSTSSSVERTVRSWRTRSSLAAAIACDAVCARPSPVNMAISCTVSRTDENTPKSCRSCTVRLTSTPSANRNARVAAVPRPARTASRSSALPCDSASRRTRSSVRVTPRDPSVRRACPTARTASRTARARCRCAARGCRSSPSPTRSVRAPPRRRR